MPASRFEPAIPAIEWPQTYTATGIGEGGGEGREHITNVIKIGKNLKLFSNVEAT
jgi:hypothetical protein